MTSGLGGRKEGTFRMHPESDGQSPWSLSPSAYVTPGFNAATVTSIQSVAPGLGNRVTAALFTASPLAPGKVLLRGVVGLNGVRRDSAA